LPQQQTGALNKWEAYILVDQADYFTVPLDFKLGKIHYLAMDFRALLILLPLLTLRLDFVPVPTNHKKVIHTHVMAYSKYRKRILLKIVDGLSLRAKISLNATLTLESQRNIRTALKALKLQDLL
jgi:hypothetical protein